MAFVTAPPYNADIAKEIRQHILDGVTIKVIMDSMIAKWGLTRFPKSTVALYKIYGDDIAQARLELHGKVGSEIYRRAMEGSDKMLEFLARSKAGWNPVQTVSVREEDSDTPDENTSAIHELAALFGKTKESEE